MSDIEYPIKHGLICLLKGYNFSPLHRELKRFAFRGHHCWQSEDCLPRMRSCCSDGCSTYASHCALCHRRCVIHDRIVLTSHINVYSLTADMTCQLILVIVMTVRLAFTTRWAVPLISLVFTGWCCLRRGKFNALLCSDETKALATNYIWIRSIPWRVAEAILFLHYYQTDQIAPLEITSRWINELILRRLIIHAIIQAHDAPPLCIPYFP